jgi:hypothetical protein
MMPDQVQKLTAGRRSRTDTGRFHTCMSREQPAAIVGTVTAHLLLHNGLDELPEPESGEALSASCILP